MFTSQFTNTHQFSTMGIEHCFRNVHFIGIIIVLKSTALSNLFNLARSKP